MKIQKIEVDEEIYQFLQDNAKPFIDTPNLVLRRLLLRKEENAMKVDSTSAVGELHSFSDGVPRALSQILEVIYLVKRNGLSRIDATHMVARKMGITPQAVIDKYDRQLNKKAFEIDRLLRDANLSELKSLLRQKFTHYGVVIEDFFSMLG